MKKFCFKSLSVAFVASVVLCGCNRAAVDEIEFESEGMLTVSVGVPGWEELLDDSGELGSQSIIANTRAGGEMLTPVTMLVYKNGENDLLKKVALSNGTDFHLNLKEGDYNLVAVCGLESAVLSDYDSKIEVATGTDFAVGQMSVTVENGVCTPSEVNIKAERQMASVAVELTGVPENVRSLKLFVKGLFDSYSLVDGWSISAEGTDDYTQIILTKGATSYSGGGIFQPCSNPAGVTYVAIATTTGGVATTLTYTAPIDLKEGTRLTQTLAYGDMMVVEGGINLGDWTDKTDEGTLSGGFGFNVGDQCFSQAATVIFKNDTYVNLMAHRPMTVTLDQVRGWDIKNIPYTLSPEIDVQRWALAPSESMPRHFYNDVITQIGWDKLDAQFRKNGLTPIDRTAKNILAYWDKTADKFYTYDFANAMFQLVEDETGEFLYYPLGIIQLAE